MKPLINFYMDKSLPHPPVAHLWNEGTALGRWGWGSWKKGPARALVQLGGRPGCVQVMRSGGLGERALGTGGKATLTREMAP